MLKSRVLQTHRGVEAAAMPLVLLDRSVWYWGRSLHIIGSWMTSVALFVRPEGHPTLLSAIG